MQSPGPTRRVKLLIEALESRQMLFAQPIVDDVGSTKRFLTLTPISLYFEEQPAGIADYAANAGRKFVRTTRAGGAMQTIVPESGRWSLERLSAVEPLGKSVVLIFDGGALWSIADGATVARPFFDAGRQSAGSAVTSQGKIYLPITDATHGDQLLVSDGTTNGTRVLAPPGASNSLGYMNSLTTTNAGVMFEYRSVSDNAMHLMRSSGTSMEMVQGTRDLHVWRLWSPRAASSSSLTASSIACRQTNRAPRPSRRAKSLTQHDSPPAARTSCFSAAMAFTEAT